MKITVEEAAKMRAAKETIEFVVHPELLPALVAWLSSRGLDMMQGPPGEDDNGLRWFIASPRSLQRES